MKLFTEISTHHTAVVGKTGSGKTSTAKLLVEHVVAQGARVCILDPIKSDWWGLISSADGKKPGLPFYILGGPHGHVQIDEKAGKTVGELVAAGDLPLSIIDMADFKPGGLQTFFCDFAPALLKKMRGIVYLVIEEAHEFAPKERAGFGGENLTIHFAKKLATAGRSKGIRLVVVTQRTQSLHNAVLGSCETLIAHRLTLPADQTPVKEWLRGNVVKDVAELVSRSLATLKTGEGWVISGEANIADKTRFPRIATYDNSATPTDDDHRHEVKTAAMDPAKLQALIGAAAKAAAADDPAVLRRRIAELEKQIANAGPDSRQLNEARLAGHKEGYREGAAKVGYSLVNATLDLRRANSDLANLADLLEAIIVDTGKAQPSADVAQRTEHRPSKPNVAGSTPAARSISSGPAKRAEGVNGPQQRILDALAWWASVGVDQPSRIQVAVIARYSPSGGAFQNPLGGLRTMGLIEYPAGGAVALTGAGRAAASSPGMPATVAEFHARLQGILNGPQWRILAPIIDAYPRAISRADVAAAAGYAPHGGAFQNPLGSLRTLGLIDYPAPGMVVALPVLFIEGAA